VRIIATSNRDLLSYVEKGDFRQDLYYRLNVFPVHVPPLRERGEDILMLAEHFLRRFARKHGIKVTGLSDSARAMILAYRWPGNVRELQNTIERAVIFSESGRPVLAAALGLPEDLKFPDTLELPMGESATSSSSTTVAVPELPPAASVPAETDSQKSRSRPSRPRSSRPAATVLKRPPRSASASAPCATSCRSTANPAPRSTSSSTATPEVGAFFTDAHSLSPTWGPFNSEARKPRIRTSDRFLASWLPNQNLHPVGRVSDPPYENVKSSEQLSVFLALSGIRS
jgi:hypothetical protein